jgi:MULE transposase domain
MTCKKSPCYKEIFQRLKDVFDLNPKEIMSDWELSIRKAAGEVFPDARLFGCWFHFCQVISKTFLKLCNVFFFQSLRRNISSDKQLLEYVSQNPEAKQLTAKFMALALLPADMVVRGFQILSKEALNHPKFGGFVAYVRRFWIVKVII